MPTNVNVRCLNDFFSDEVYFVFCHRASKLLYSLFSTICKVFVHVRFCLVQFRAMEKEVLGQSLVAGQSLVVLLLCSGILFLRGSWVYNAKSS